MQGFQNNNGSLNNPDVMWNLSMDWWSNITNLPNMLSYQQPNFHQLQYMYANSIQYNPPQYNQTLIPQVSGVHGEPHLKYKKVKRRIPIYCKTTAEELSSQMVDIGSTNMKDFQASLVKLINSETNKTEKTEINPHIRTYRYTEVLNGGGVRYIDFDDNPSRFLSDDDMREIADAIIKCKTFAEQDAVTKTIFERNGPAYLRPGYLEEHDLVIKESDHIQQYNGLSSNNRGYSSRSKSRSNINYYGKETNFDTYDKNHSKSRNGSSLGYSSSLGNRSFGFSCQIVQDYYGTNYDSSKTNIYSDLCSNTNYSQSNSNRRISQQPKKQNNILKSNNDFNTQFKAICDNIGSKLCDNAGSKSRPKSRSKSKSGFDECGYSKDIYSYGNYTGRYNNYNSVNKKKPIGTDFIIYRR